MPMELILLLTPQSSFFETASLVSQVITALALSGILIVLIVLSAPELGFGCWGGYWDSDVS